MYFRNRNDHHKHDGHSDDIHIMIIMTLI